MLVDVTEDGIVYSLLLLVSCRCCFEYVAIYGAMSSYRRFKRLIVAKDHID